MSKAARVAGTAVLALGAAGAAYKLIASGLQPESQIFGPTLISGGDPNEWALTYDDGPNPRSTPELLDVLARFSAHATFFMVGKFIRQQPQLVRRVHAAGHLIGNHTMSHPFLATKPMNFVQREIRDCTALLEDTLGAPVRYFRAPYGARRPAILRFVRAQGLTPVQWNVQGNDWEPIGPGGILANIERGLLRARTKSRGANILLHDGFDEQQGYDRTDTVRATELLLQQAQRQAVRLVTVDTWV
ncbi:MAG TPA: polysaccharide deacetylase family protein [Acidobacteriaceae bacterium]|nr:polysaccharide deacetylase family protein [Acidobacteriaceae bacterium]